MIKELFELIRWIVKTLIKIIVILFTEISKVIKFISSTYVKSRKHSKDTEDFNKRTKDYYNQSKEIY